MGGLNSRIVMSGVRLSVKAIIVREGRLLVLKCRDDDGVEGRRLYPRILEKELGIAAGVGVLYLGDVN